MVPRTAGQHLCVVTRTLPPLLSGRLELAEERLAIAATHAPDEPMIVILQGLLHARRGHSDLAHQCVRRALDSPRSFSHTHHVHHHVACVYALLEDPDQARTRGGHRVPVLAILPNRSPSREPAPGARLHTTGR